MKVVLCPVFWENNVKKIVLNQVQAADCRQAKPIERTKAEKRQGGDKYGKTAEGDRCRRAVNVRAENWRTGDIFLNPVEKTHFLKAKLNFMY